MQSGARAPLSVFFVPLPVIVSLGRGYKNTVGIGNILVPSRAHLIQQNKILPFMENDILWRITSDGRRPLMEDDL